MSRTLSKICSLPALAAMILVAGPALAQQGGTNRDSGVRGLEQSQSEDLTAEQLRRQREAQERLRKQLEASRQYGQDMQNGLGADRSGQNYRQQLNQLNQGKPGGATPFFRQQMNP